MFSSKNEFLTASSGYKISRSVRLRGSATASFTKALSSNGSLTTWTWSGWVKRGALGNGSTYRGLFGAGANSGNPAPLDILRFTDVDTLQFSLGASNAANTTLTTTAVYRDPSAWYHIVAVYDSTNATASNRAKLYVNGSQITAFGTATYPAQNTQTTAINVASATTQIVGGQYFGASGGVSVSYDGYMTEVNFIDGQALTPSSFGVINSIGVWSPIKYTGTYGTNGFYLNFSDNSNNTATTIGKDYSGNGNNWTPNNISVTAGATYDSMLDVPTLYADGGNGRGNYCVLNPLDWQNTSFPVTNGNLTWTSTTTASGSSRGTMGMTSGQWYWEITATSVGAGSCGVGVAKDNSTYYGSGQAIYDSVTGNKYIDGTTTAYGATWATGAVIGVAYDAGAGQITFYKNNTSQGTITLIGYAGVNVCPLVIDGSSLAFTLDINFGQRPFSYTPPAGYVALNTQNLPTPTISNGANYMAATTYTGTGSAINITNGGNNPAGITFKPDLVWGKVRNTTGNNLLFDSLRGTGTFLISNTTAADGTNAQTLTAFNSNGYSYGTDTTLNTNANTYVAWQWQAGAGTSSSNTSGSITSTVSVGATQGFSVVTFTAPASGTGTVGHGLNVAPAMILLKSRATVANWTVYHQSVGNTGGLALNLTNAVNTTSGYWNNTSPTSSLFTIGTSFNGLSTMVAYCFSEVAGYSKFGSYTGNGSTDGPFVFTNFQPRWVMIKRTDAVESWVIVDTSRNSYNLTNLLLYPNLSNAEGTGTNDVLDILSNGFKLRGNGTSVNVNTGTYIYAAFASNPTKLSLAR